MQEKKTTSDEVAKGFSKAKFSAEERVKIKHEEQKAEKAKQKQEAQDVLSYITNILASGSIEVKIKRPVRKVDYASTGRIVSVITSFTEQEMKFKIAYSKGKEIKIKGKKAFVPFTDIVRPSNVEVIRLVQEKQPENEKDK